VPRLALRKHRTITDTDTGTVTSMETIIGATMATAIMSTTAPVIIITINLAMSTTIGDIITIITLADTITIGKLGKEIGMMRVITLILGLALGGAALAHSDSKWTKGPQGGHVVDAGGGKQDWELVAKGNELTLYVLDAEEKPVPVDGGKATGEVLIGGKTHKVDFKPAGENTLKANGDFKAAKAIKVIVKTDNVGGQSFQARLAPLN
jgi:hypothetical protein